MGTASGSGFFNRQLSAFWYSLRRLARVPARTDCPNHSVNQNISHERLEQRWRIDWSILNRHNDGMKPEQIATELGVGLGEVLSLVGPRCGLAPERFNSELATVPEAVVRDRAALAALPAR